jgi:hypothetical protein
MSQTIRIDMRDHGRGQVFIDDVELEGVVAIEFRAMIGEQNVVTVHLSPRTVTVRGPSELIISTAAPSPGIDGGPPC